MHLAYFVEVMPLLRCRCDSQMHRGSHDAIASEALLKNTSTSESNLSSEWLLPVVACLRSAIVGNHKNEAYFVVSDGALGIQSFLWDQ